MIFTKKEVSGKKRKWLSANISNTYEKESSVNFQVKMRFSEVSNIRLKLRKVMMYE